MPRTLPLIASALALALAACAPMDGSANRADASDVPPVRVLGEPQSCIPLASIRQTVVRSDEVIDFEMRGGDVYRNTLADRCPSLDLQRSITYDTSLNQLCRPEIIYVLENFAGQLQRGPGCALGNFVPVEYIDEDKAED
ncbi:MAG: hypothetical protein V2I27_08375 [Erythrobacter sp.]|jgi:hypothetical protein|nr:hypothetical protein [Erythrobacter sp.]